MVPEPIARVCFAEEVLHFSLGDALRASSLSVQGASGALEEYVATFRSRNRFALVVVLLPPFLARAAVFLGQVFAWALLRLVATVKSVLCKPLS